MLAGGSKLYADHVKVYPQRIWGKFRSIKWAILAMLLLIYYLVPWIRWDRGPDAPDQAVLIDMAGRRAYFFWIEIWPQEVYYLAGLLILGAFGLFFATSLLGRVWCGFTCPQTVWTDLFMQVERWVEGDRNARIKLDGEPVSLGKSVRKLTKHGIWLLIALATGGAWAMYFDDAPTLLRNFFTGQAGELQYVFVGLFTATTYILAGWAREQVCIYMCPWPRFQAAMFDEHTMLVTYEEWRGEPRGPLKRAAAEDKPQGDCIDCGLCVRVCPTGVDIRQGQQLACIGCGLCVDACNSVMAKINRPLELITYDALSAQADRAAGRPPKRRFIRPRTVVYFVMILAVGIGMLATLSQRARLDVSLLADRAPLFVRLKDGGIQNGYTLKILNMLREPGTFSLEVEGLPGIETRLIGADSSRIAVAPDDVGTFRLLLLVPKGAAPSGSSPITVRVTNLANGEVSIHDATFNAPQQ
ncbi:cytochrome c oxidase accessory protein FixG [Dongia mobilis]|uniref:Cytochrome c oxidase accessory protein FixG n=1 Tax=Dongia mobilis TaxID=578943 RepID=A0A4R6WH09_9PROT|nr:cytochrome c oxidase accessory protein CcoG [Dongia mobilis]TDQ77555.1 cytochrome c oxidase accessory protein FixG [Dongia mobilis]